MDKPFSMFDALEPPAGGLPLSPLQAAVYEGLIDPGPKYRAQVRRLHRLKLEHLARQALACGDPWAMEQIAAAGEALDEAEAAEEPGRG